MNASDDRIWEALANTPRLLHLVWEAVPGYLLASQAVVLLRAGLPAAQLYATKLVVDRVIASAGAETIDWHPLIFLVGLRLGLSLLREIFNQANTYFAQVLKDRFALYSDRKLLQQAIVLDLAHYERPEFHDTLDRAQKSGSTYPMRVLTTLSNIAAQTVTLASLLVLLLQFGPAIALLLFATSLPAFWIGTRFSGRRFWMLRRQTTSGRVASYLQYLLLDTAYAKEIRLFALGDYLLQRWQEIRRQFNNESADLASNYALARAGGGILANLGFYAAYGWAIVRAARGAITIGDFTMYAGAFQQTQNAIPSLLENINLLYESNLYANQYFEFLGLQPTVVSPTDPKPFPTPLQRELALQNVSFTYPGADRPVLQNICLTVRAGESVALVGANGAGKTTLLKLLTRLYDPTDGKIAIDGISLADFDLASLRSNIGILFQDFARYSLSAKENIGFGNLSERDNRDRLDTATQQAGAIATIESLPHGYETILGKAYDGGIDLSGGQWQKIGMARAFMSDAQILILDEPTAALDAIAEYEIFQQFRALTQGKTTFLVSHRFSTVRLADKIVVLDGGAIVEVGSHAELLAAEGLYARMFRLQAQNYEI